MSGLLHILTEYFVTNMLPKTFITDYPLMLHNIPGDQRPQLCHGESQKSHVFAIC
jgi:hypothetical protein